jgi:hypothetical protein
MRYFLSVFFVASTLLFGQQQPINTTVVVIEDSLVSKAFALKMEADKERYTSYEFTIQLYYGDYGGAQRTLKSIARIAPDLKPDLSFETPNYKVQVGPFKKRSEAKSRLQELKQHYRGAFLLEPKMQY